METEDKRTRGPEDKRIRKPEGQITRGPDDQKPKGSKDPVQRTKGNFDILRQIVLSCLYFHARIEFSSKFYVFKSIDCTCSGEFYVFI